MMPILALMLANIAQPAAAAPEPPPPPEEMVDFLGRRRLCLELPPETERTASDRAERRRLACASLASEERHWRERYRNDAGARSWLDRDPRDFRVTGPIVVRRWDGPPGAYVHRMEWSGTEEGGPAPFQLVVDSDAENGGATLFTASFGDVPARTFRIDNRRFPWLDLQSVRATLRSGAPADGLRIELRFGYRRGYCLDSDGDDRPRLTIEFRRDNVAASYEDRTNCGFNRVSLSGN